MIIENIFQQFVASDIIDIDLVTIENYCYDMKNLNQGKYYSNRGGWQSPDILKNEFEKLIFLNQIQNSLNKFKEKMAITNHNIFIDSCWININQKSHYNLSHAHYGCLFSGVIYIKVPKNSGKIIFERPIDTTVQSYLDYWHLQAGRNFPSNSYFSTECAVQPKEKMLLLFPSWLKHRVESSENDEERISIAFNCGVV